MRRNSLPRAFLFGACIALIAFLPLMAPLATGQDAKDGKKEPAAVKDSPESGETSAKEGKTAGKDAKKDKRGPYKPWEARWRSEIKPKTFEIKNIETNLSDRLRSLIGLAVLLGICIAMSKDRKHIPWRLVAVGLGLQLLFGLLMLQSSAGAAIFDKVNNIVNSLLGFSDRGSEFIFGDLINYEFGRSVFAFKVLPTIIFFSSLMTVLYHLGVMQWVVKLIAIAMQKTMKTSGAETLSAAGNIFVGQTEAPLLIAPFVDKMTESELMAVMTGGFATVAGGVLAAYVGLLQPFFPEVAGHLLTASIMSAPAALVCAKIMIPEVNPKASATYGSIQVKLEKPDVNVIDAAARGASEGLKLALNVGAMLLAFIALIALLDALLGWTCNIVGIDTLLGFAENEQVTISFFLGKILAPLAWLMGVEWNDAEKVGALLGKKTVLNEFVAYLDIAIGFGGDENYLSPRSLVICSYSLCGFANFSSIAIQIGGISGIAPERRSDLARLGLRAMIAGTIAAFMTGTVAGIII